MAVFFIITVAAAEVADQEQHDRQQRGGEQYQCALHGVASGVGNR